MAEHFRSCTSKIELRVKAQAKYIKMLLVCRHLGRCRKASIFLLTYPTSRVHTHKKTTHLLQRAKLNFLISQHHWHILLFSLLSASFFLLLKEDEQVLHLAQWTHNEADWNSECYSLLITTPFTPTMYQFLTAALHVWKRKIDQGKRKKLVALPGTLFSFPI